MSSAGSLVSNPSPHTPLKSLRQRASLGPFSACAGAMKLPAILRPQKGGSKSDAPKHRDSLDGDTMRSVPETHVNTLSNVIYGTSPHLARARVNPDAVSWRVADPEYNPVEYTADIVHAFDRTKREGGWADPADFSAIESEWDERRTSCATSLAKLKHRGLPRNPVGRTGMVGRGLLGKWGPNQAADPIVTCRSPVTGLLYMVAIQRGDTGEWAIPGGMVDDGELVTATLIREFEEEAAEVSVDMRKVLKEILDPEKAEYIYQGYVDDPRNTDNAWMETTVSHTHCAPHLAERLRLSAGDDATHAAWICIEDGNERFLNLYADHRKFVELALKRYLKKEREQRRNE